MKNSIFYDDSTKSFQPLLACNSHHGIYMYQSLFKSLTPFYRDQAIEQLSKADVECLENGPDDDWHFDSANHLECVEFREYETGVKFCIVANEDLWFVPEGFDCEGWFI